jgi:hypothetical protein
MKKQELEQNSTGIPKAKDRKDQEEEKYESWRNPALGPP